MYTILHIDSSNFFRKVLKQAFEEKGFTHLEATNVISALEIIDNSNIDIILIELELEKNSCEAFINKIHKTKYSGIPLFILAANDKIEEKKKMFELGVVDYITKNIVPSDIVKQILSKRFYNENTIIYELRKKSIAVLDDSELELNIIKDIFNKNNINNVDYYKNAVDFLECGKTYDIYLIDIVLKECSGEDIIVTLREHNKNCVVIAISVIDNYKTISRILYSGADDYIIKPFEMDVFLARIKSNVRSFILINELNQKKKFLEHLLDELDEKNKMLQQMVIIDPLTGLFNHTYIYKKLEDDVKKAIRYHNYLTIMMVDIDYFKRINDTYGHQVGDFILSEVGLVIKDDLREVDVVGRYSGEKFLVILPETNLESAMLVAERLRKRIKELKWKSTSLKMSISIGVKELEYEEDALELIEKAEDLLQVAKKNGRDRVVGE